MVDNLIPKWPAQGKHTLSPQPYCTSLSWTADGQTLLSGWTDGKVTKPELFNPYTATTPLGCSVKPDTTTNTSPTRHHTQFHTGPCVGRRGRRDVIRLPSLLGRGRLHFIFPCGPPERGLQRLLFEGMW